MALFILPMAVSAQTIKTEQLDEHTKLTYEVNEVGQKHGQLTVEFNQPKIQHGWQGTAKLTLTYVDDKMTGDATYVADRSYYDNNVVNVSTMKSIKILGQTKNIYVQYTDKQPLTKFKTFEGSLAGKIDITIGSVRYVGTCNDSAFVVGKFEIYNKMDKTDNKYFCVDGGTYETDANGYDKADIELLNKWNTWAEQNPEKYIERTTGRNAEQYKVEYRESAIGRQRGYITLLGRDDIRIKLPKHKTVYVPNIPKY